MPKIKKDLKRKASGSIDINRGSEKATVTVNISYPDTTTPTMKWAEMVDEMFGAAVTVANKWDGDPDQGDLDLKNESGDKGIGGDGDKE